MPHPPPLPPLSPPPLPLSRPSLPQPRREPAVVGWFRIYCWGMAACLLLFGLFGLCQATGIVAPKLGFLDEVIAVDNPTLRQELLDDEIRDAKGAVVVAAVLIPALLLGAMMPARRWGYSYGIVLLVLPSLLCITLFATIPLLIYWHHAENRAYFGA